MQCKKTTETHECVGKLFQLHTDSLKLKHSLFQFIQRIKLPHIKERMPYLVISCSMTLTPIFRQLFLDLLQTLEKLFQYTFILIIISPQATD